MIRTVVLAADDGEIPVGRVPISLPCQVPVLPGTADTTAPIEQRTERCCVDAYWLIGSAMMCDLHLRVVFGPDYELIREAFPDVELAAVERLPWSEMPRYDQSIGDPSLGAGLERAPMGVVVWDVEDSSE